MGSQWQWPRFDHHSLGREKVPDRGADHQNENENSLHRLPLKRRHVRTTRDQPGTATLSAGRNAVRNVAIILASNSVRNEYEW